MHFANGVLIPSEPAIDLVRILSEGTYTSFPQALKEFVSNAFDADAPRVEIQIDEDANGLTIRDNGEGMTLEDFGDAFASIARSGKAQRGVKRGRTRSGRVKIGKFGLGTLAVVAICDRITVRSSKGGSTEGFAAKLDVANLRKHFDRGQNLSDWWKFEAEKWDNEKRSTHFTEIRLEVLSTDIRSFLERPGKEKSDEEFDNVSQLSGVDELAWQLGITCPVPYIYDYPIPKKDINRRRDGVIVEKSRRLLRDNFSLVLNGNTIRRNILLPHYRSKQRQDPVEWDRLMKRGLGYDATCFRSHGRAPVKFEGYVMVQAQQLFPLELRGLLVRMRGVGIGGHRTFNLTGTSIATMLPSLSGEIWVETGLDDALQFDRESFREDHPNFQWFRQRVAEEVEKQSKGFRDRSARRSKLKKSRKKSRADQPTPPDATPAPTSKESAEASGPADLFLDPAIFKDSPTFISFLIPQINGCWDHSWFEACALICRRLLETLIIHLYETRGWARDIRNIEGYVGLQKLVDVVSSDARVGLEKRSKEGLAHLKMMGDVAAHDYKVRVRRPDLERKRTELRLACERLLFIAQNRGG
jgi:hypothetical protein